MRTLTWDQVHGWRMAQHFLTARAAPSQYIDVISQIGGLQAQVMSAAELALFARADDISPEFVQNALWKDRTLIKTWVNRGTLHIIAAKDHPIYVGALSTLRRYETASWQKHFGVTLDELNSIMDGLQVILTDTGITREELADRIAAHLKTPAIRDHLLSGWGSLLKPPAFKGLLCYGPNDGQNVTFVRPAAWIGKWEPIEPESAIDELARRFLAAYGPATTDEFARWLGLTKSQAKKSFKRLGDEIEPVSVDGWETHLLVSSIEQIESEKAPQIVRLLPLFDPYTIAVAKHFQFLMPEEHKALVYRNQGWISAVVLVNGRIEGVWEYDKKSKHTEITAKMFRKPSKSLKKDVESEARRLNKFMDTEIQLTFAEI